MNAICSLIKSSLLRVRVVWEVQLCYRFTYRDIPPALISGCAFTFAAAKHCECLHSPTDYVSVLSWAFFYFCPYLYSFNLCNQITGIEEDRGNKPDRPIPSGFVTIQGAKQRWCVVTAWYILAGVIIGNVWSSFLWIFVTYMLCCGGWDKHWFTKNCIAMSLGAAVQGWAAWSIVAGDPWMNQKHAVFSGIISVCFGSTANLQDLRDVEGDYQCGRKTMPIELGMKASKSLLSILLFIQVMILYTTIWSQYLSPVAILKVVYVVVNVLMHLYIILRVFCLDLTSLDLHHTYYFYTVLFAFTVFPLIAVL